MAISKLKNGEACGRDTIPAELSKWEEKCSRRSFQKYGRKRSYHINGNLAYIQLIRKGMMIMCDNRADILPYKIYSVPVTGLGVAQRMGRGI